MCKERLLHYKPETCTDITNACAVLHNICIDTNDHLPEDELMMVQETDDAIIMPAGALQAVGNENRLQIIEYMKMNQ